MKVWMVAREYSGIAEAGGVKNVTCSLSESLVKLGHKVTLFIPLYGCTDLTCVEDFTCVHHKPVVVRMCNRRIIVTFSYGRMNGVDIVFVGNNSFSEKKAVYTYTKEEEIVNPSHKRGTGHEDSLFLNTLFQKSVVFYAETCDITEKPDVINCHDATAALVPVFINEEFMNYDARLFYKDTKCVVTIHNAGAGYHHEFKNVDEACYYTMLSRDFLSKGLNGERVEPFVLASKYSHLTTVSPEYASEILSIYNTRTDGLSELFIKNGVSIKGITNGIDFYRYDPRDKKLSLLPFSYNPMDRDLCGKYKCREFFLDNQECSEVVRYGHIDKNPNSVFITYHGRVVSQKGIQILAASAEKMLKENLPVKFIFIGQGESRLEDMLKDLSNRYEGKCVFFNGYSKSFSRLCIAVSDFSVCPSDFEPCGTEDFISQILGTIPVAHATGGLKKIVDEESGFLYETNDSMTLYDYLASLVRIVNCAGHEILSPMISFASNYVKCNYTWEEVAKKYIEFFNFL